MRKSFDDTSSRLDEKYGEKFWQNQVQRVIKQSKNYSMLYNTNKKLTDKEKIEIKAENEKIKNKNKQLEEELEKIKAELNMYKSKVMQFDLNSNPPKGKFIMKPKKRFPLPGPSKSGGEMSKYMSSTTTKKQPKNPEKVISEKETVAPTRLTFSGSNRNTFPKNSSENNSSSGNGAPVTIKPKVNDSSTLKAPLKKFNKKPEPKKVEKVSITIKILATSERKETQTRSRS